MAKKQATTRGATTPRKRRANRATAEPTRRCKVGDLAIILRSCCPTAIGRIVEVLALEIEDADHAGQWQVRFNGAPVFHPHEKRSLRFGWIGDSALVPISGPAALATSEALVPEVSHG